MHWPARNQIFASVIAVSFLCSISLAQQDNQAIQRHTPQITAPTLTRKTEPDYPPELRKEKVQGTVTVAAIVDPKGHTKDVKVVKSLNPELDRQAVLAVRRWRFKPALKDGKPVAVQVSIAVDFRLY
ncbi:MAG TPA: energy transducer TonB [Terriglobales bacterium]|nr:energy transducer TonB [Terriglobales bacterium]